MLENENIDIEKYKKYKKDKLIECHKSLNLILKLNEFNLKITRLKDSNYKVQTIEPCTICYPYNSEERILIDVLGNYTFDKDYSCLMELPQNKRIIQFYAGLKDISKSAIYPEYFENSEGARIIYAREIEPCLTILKLDGGSTSSLAKIPCVHITDKDINRNKPMSDKEFDIAKVVALVLDDDLRSCRPYSEYTFLIDNSDIRKYEPDEYLKRILKDNPYL